MELADEIHFVFYVQVDRIEDEYCGMLAFPNAAMKLLTSTAEH